MRDEIKKRVFLVDDHPLVREHLTALLQREPDLAVCGEAPDTATALSLIPQRQPDLVILDLSLKVSNGLELLRELKRVHPKMPVLVLSMHEEAPFAERALRAGALGYITKAEATIDILAAIRTVLEHRTYVSDGLVDGMLRKITQVLAAEEIEIFKMSRKGFSLAHIARQQQLEIFSVEFRLTSIREKLQPLSHSPLFVYAVERLVTDYLNSSSTSSSRSIPCHPRLP